MIKKSSSDHLLGLYLSGTTLLGAELSQNKGHPKIENLFEIPIEDTQEPSKLVKPLYLSDGEALSSLSSRLLSITAAETSEVLIRPCELKLTKDSDVESVFAFQAEPLLPYALEEGVIDKIKIAQNPQGTSLTLIALRKDHLKNHLEKWSGHDIQPEIVSCVPVALAAFSNYFLTPDTANFVLHLGPDSTTCLLVKDGKLLAAHSISENVYGLLHTVMRDNALSEEEALQKILGFDFSNMQPLKDANLIQGIEAFRLGIARLIYALAKQAKGKQINSILVTGIGGTWGSLSQVLCKDFNRKIITPSENTLFNASSSDLQKFAIPIGLAIVACPGSGSPNNFRKDEFAYPHPWKRLKKPITIYLLLCAFLSLALFLATQSWLGYQEDKLKDQYGQLLTSMDKPFDGFENEYMKKNQRNTSLSETPSLQKLTGKDLLGRLYYLQKELENTPDIFPLQPNIARVSDVLAWLATHPNVVKSPDSSESLSPLLQIESLAYTMLKRPEQGKKQEKYQVKVEIEFSSSSPKEAREFHDALITANSLVDPKGEVKWSSSRGKYRTSFFLKDKTIYP